MVCVISKNDNPLMPCSNAIARLLLKQNKAKCIRRTPFTIKLLYDTTEFIQPLTHGVDTGSSKMGSAVVSDKGEVIYLSEIEVRNDITDKMKRRSEYRRNRRNRKTRYRPARWANRKNSIKKDRFSPIMTSKINSHLKEIKFVKSILPITKLILETATFDPHALKNPAVLSNKWPYQKGINYGFGNTKAYVLDRDNHICQNCIGVDFKTDHMLCKKCISYKDIQKTKGVRSEQKIPTGKIQGLRKFDKVRYLGKEYFIKGRMSTGYVILMNIHGETQRLKPIPKFSKMERVSARVGWLKYEERVTFVSRLHIA